MEKTDLSRFPALQIGAIDKLEEADESGLYQWMEDYPLLLRQYPLQDCAQGADDFHTALRVMDWLSAHTHYCGLQFRLIPDRTPAILAYGYDKPFRNAINCRFKAIAMADCLLALQKKAYPVALIAQKEKGKDQPCHLMVQMYARELEKWVVFDPSFRTYFLDETGRPLDIFELREQFMEEKRPGSPVMISTGRTAYRIFTSNRLSNRIDQYYHLERQLDGSKDGKSLQTRKPLTGFRPDSGR